MAEKQDGYALRFVTDEDAEEILGIYTPYVTGTCVSFETEVPDLENFRERVRKISEAYPYLVCEFDGKVIGYAYASRHGERAAYKYSVNVSVYVSPEHQRQGVGRMLYLRLFELLLKRGFYTAYAGITVPNEKSEKLHRSLGFNLVGIYHNVGYKHGKWLDVMWLEKPLREYGTPRQ